MPDLSGPLTSAGDGKGAPLRQGPPSTLGAVRSRPLRRLAVASLGVALGALAAVNAADAGPNDGEIAALHDEIAAEEAEIAVLAQQVGTAEQQVSDLLALIAEGDQAIMNLEADIAEAGARACISYLTIELKGSIPDRLRTEVGNRIFGCDDCQDVCPWNRRAPETREPAFLPRPSTLSLIDLMRMTPEDFRTQFKSSPIKRSKRRGFLRNVAVALGNTGDPRAVPALVDALGDEEPLVREHVAWALGRLGGTEAEQALAHARLSEPDPSVREAIDRALDAKTGDEVCRN